MTKEPGQQKVSQKGFRPPADEQQTAFHPRNGQLPADVSVASTSDSTGVEAIAAELQEVRVPDTAQQFVEASLSAVEAVLSDNNIVRNSQAFGIATRLAQRLEEYLVVSSDFAQDEAVQQYTPARTPSLFAQGLFERSDNPVIATIQREFVIEINGLVRQLGSAIEQDESISQSGDSIKTFADLARRLQHGAAEHRPKELATAMQMETQTVFVQLPELVDVQAESQRQIQLHNPLASHYTEYWRTRAQATAIVRGIEHPQPSDLPQLAEMLALRGVVAAEVIEASRDADAIEDTAETAALHDAYTVLVDFIDGATKALEAIEGPEQNQSLARQLASFNLLRMNPEQAIALLNAAEAVKQHNPELLFRLLGVSTRVSDGTATESDLFGNPLMIALDQTSRDLATRRAVSPGIAVLRDRIDTILTVDQHRRPLPFLNEQQIRAAESAMKDAVTGGRDRTKPDIVALIMLMQYTPVVELGKLMREAGFERRAEYVDRIRNGTPREILADLMDMPEELLEDPEVLAAWRERYDLDHPDLLHRYAMRYVLDVQWYHDASTKGFLNVNRAISTSSQDADVDTDKRQLPYAESITSDERLAEILKFRKMILQETRAAIVQDRGLRGRLFGVTTDSILETFIHDPSVGADDSVQPIAQTRKDEYIANTHAFILGLWAHAPKEQLATPSAMMQMVEDLKRAVDTATINKRNYDAGNHYTLGPLQFVLSVLPQEDHMSDGDWASISMPSGGTTLPGEITDALATHEFLRPGRLFTRLIGSMGSQAISILEVLRTEPLTGPDSSPSGIDIDNLRKRYPLFIHSREDINTSSTSKVIRFVDDPQLLTPVERELNQEMEEIMIDQMVQYVLHVIVDQYKKILAKQPENFTEETTLPTNIFHQFLEVLKQDPNRKRLFRNALRKYCGEGGVVAYVNRERLKTASDSDDEFLNRVNEYIQDFESYMIDNL